MTMKRVALAIVFVSTTVGVAAADDTFESKATGAQRVRQLEDVVWALTAACDKGDDVQQRQCRVLRDTRAKALAGATLLVEAESDALAVGTWNPAKKSVAIALSSCIRCGGVQIEGRSWLVTGATPQVAGGKAKTALIYDNAKQFSDEPAAKKWLKTVDQLRVQMLVKVPDKRRFQVSGKDGLLLDVLGYRVVHPCTGAVVIANPPAGNVEADKKACGEPPATTAP